MMSLQLGETFSGFKIQRPIQWVLCTQNSLLFKYNELPKIFVPLVSEGLLRPQAKLVLTTIYISTYLGLPGKIQVVSRGRGFTLTHI